MISHGSKPSATTQDTPGASAHALSAGSRSTARTKHLVIAILAICFCFCVTSGWVILEARRTAWNHAREVGAALVGAAASDIERNIENLNLSLQGVIENLQIPGLDDLPPKFRQILLFDRSTTARHLSSLVVIREDGTVRFDSRKLEVSLENLADRDYFRIHKYNDFVGLFISRPIRSRLTGTSIIVFSRRLSHPDGSFAGVVVGAMKLDYLENLFKSIALGPHASVTLARTDGIVLVRSPEDSEFFERDPHPSRIIDLFSEHPSGHFETRATTDGQLRLFNYRQIGTLPILVAIGQTADDIYAQWWPQAWAIGALMLALMMSTIALAIFLRRSEKLQRVAEAELTALATTDGLTGLANRRSFNTAIDRQWRIARRTSSSLGLLMIDADNFKIFNDTFGHQTGDRLLALLANAITRNLQRPGDLGVRYGGDEFIVLLPDSTLEGAETVARQIRQAFVSACHTDDIAAQYSRLSIGLACLSPSGDDDSHVLVAAADKALYRAKTLGRNRTEIAQVDQPASPSSRSEGEPSPDSREDSCAGPPPQRKSR
ncbi:sensor domain-containing diguanylate cyclase [Afipia sp. TerB]